MAEQTQISWTDSTFNPWWGCQRISPACDNCYAAALDHRTGGSYWETGNKPRAMSDANWKKPLRWHHEAQVHGNPRKVFCGSMCDVFDKNAPDGQRERLFELIRQTPMLQWQLLTKRPTNIEKYLPDDWGDGYDNVWLGVTVEDCKYGLPRIDVLKNIPARIRFLSVEPLLQDLGNINLTGIDWVIIGGESGPCSRPMSPEWVDNVMHQCRRQNVAVWFKQWGGNKKDKGGCLVHDAEIKQWPHTTG
ncbi:MAG: phage Gp37/Gp68 family protein [Gammaproteobacteria bacterium]|nr:phage Gp37/Gp68 family protein [Gammaproteobacteria bacterium]